jgi:hypothetical protein
VTGNLVGGQDSGCGGQGWDFVRFLGVRSGERLLRLANIDRAFWIANERAVKDGGYGMQGTGMKLRAVFPDPWLLTPAPSPVHLFLSHPAGGFNNYFRPVSFPVARAIGPETGLRVPSFLPQISPMAADGLGIGGWPCPARLSALGTSLSAFPRPR